MSVGLYKYSGDIEDDNSTVLLSEPIASQRIYDQYFTAAISELGILYFQDGAEIRFENLERVLLEIQLLMEWIQNKVNGEEKQFLLERLVRIKSVVADSLRTKADILYVF